MSANLKWYLGTNFGHGSSVAAIREDGVLAFAVEEGRLIGDKETSRFPSTAIDLVLETMKSRPSRWGEGWNPVGRFMLKGVATTARYAFRDQRYIEERFWRETKRLGVHAFEVARWKKELSIPKATGHHIAHAYSLLPWGLKPNTLVFVSDYTSEKAAISAFHWNGVGLQLIRNSPFPHSLGAMFHHAAAHLGFLGRTAPGKLMAFAGCGRPRWLSMLEPLMHAEDGRVIIDHKRFPAWRRRGAWSYLGERERHTAFGQAVLNISEANEDGADFAASVQDWFTEITWECIAANVAIARNIHRLEVNQVALAGGCALNCQTNGAITRRVSSLGLDSLMVSPWSDDCGTAIGAAAMQAKNAGCETFELATPFIGPLPSKLTSGKCDDYSVSIAVNALCAGKVIGLVSGRLEFGPRALGGRCILANPLDSNIKSRLNCMKGRPQFMPFAAVIHPDDVSTMLTAPPSTNMAWTVPLRSAFATKLPGIAHPTGEVRAQLLRPDDTPLLDRVLSGFRKKTGVGALLLTSLNGRGEAIPAFLEDAIKISHQLGLDGVLHDAGWIRIGDVAKLG